MHFRIAAAALLAVAFALSATALPAAAQSTSTAKEETKKPKRSLTAGMKAANERRKKCGAEWKEAKAAGSTKGQKWPQYYSACNKRLKAAGA